MRMKHRFAAIMVAGMGSFCLAASADPPPSDAAMAAATELVTVKGDTAMIPNLIATMRNQAVAAIAAKAHVTTDRAASVFDDILMPEFKLHASELSGSIAYIYAQNFTVDEIHQMTAFFRSEVGQKLLAKSPLIFQESRAAGRDWGKRIAIDAMKKHAQELHEKGINL